MLFSIDPTGHTGPGFPDEAAKVDLVVSEQDCPTLPDAKPAILGGVTGWRKTGPLVDFPGVSIDAWGAHFSGRCFQVNAYFGPENHDQAIFEQIVSSFTFN
jgi:hypothetical protein